MPEVHALLSASKSKQWLHCPPSVRLQENFPNESSVFAKEGTFAHEVCEYKVKRYLHEEVKQPQSKQFDTEEIDQITDIYAEFVIGVVQQMKQNGCEPLVLVEQRVDYSHIAPSGFGTADMLIIGKDEQGRGLLHVCDFKAGQGVFVEADHNSQMMLYAIGGLHAYGYIYPIETVRMTIIQPRLENISTFECSRKELEEWGDSIRPIAQLAFEGKGKQTPGEWCRFCRAKPVCQACANEALALCREEFLQVDATDAVTEASGANETQKKEEKPPAFKQPGLVPLEKLASILPTLNRISSWIESVFAYMSTEAITHSVQVPGYKVVEGRSKRIFSDSRAVEDAAVSHGYTDIYKRQLISLTDFEKLMGRRQFQQILGPFVLKPPGKLVLVPDSDPRPPANLSSTAEQDFIALPGQE